MLTRKPAIRPDDSSNMSAIPAHIEINSELSISAMVREKRFNRLQPFSLNGNGFIDKFIVLFLLYLIDHKS